MPITFANAGTRLIVTGTAANFANDLSLPNASGQIRITTPNATNTTLNGVISGGGPNLEWFVQASTSGNTGSLTLNGVNTFQGKLNNQRGPLILGNASAAGSALIFLDTNLNPAGDIQLAGSFTLPNSIHIQSGAVNKFAVAAGLSAGLSGRSRPQAIRASKKSATAS